MKRKDKFSLIILLLAITFFFCECSETKTTIDKWLPKEIQQVKISFYSQGKVTKWLLEKEEINKWETWVKNLLLTHKTFETGHSPSDSDGSECYDFVLNDGDISISYVMPGKERYIVFNNEWYLVLNSNEFIYYEDR